ncbi:ShlB/FhaC/HecB family hemolysin secretion/activation protein [Stutzerimonas nitrititolerans]|uniref:ShlB/FhaC/HecB family hemolysin secretion/activation protein n=1 Tax=Stutzerimonas nitrititolerans TaxID=2482751 RepID=UPI0028A9D452|nr:ShlB/FhaC/HecB family hemolysin secretion/activation protein [Stutzerimonas nitrititolerans]
MPNIHAVPPSSFLPPSAPSAVVEPRGATARRRLANLLALWLCSTSGLALAQTPSDLEAAARQAERLQNEMNQRIQQQRLQDLQSDQPPTRLQISPQTPRPRESTVCRDIDKVEIANAALLSERVRRDIQESYQGRCLGVAEIEQLLADVTAAYMSRGYVAARAYLPGQDLSQGILTIEVEEGQLERIDINDGEKRSISPGNVFPGEVGEPLNLRDLEQALDQINRLASNNATMEILPGSEPGDSVVRFNNEPERPYRLNLTYDNSGQKATGRNQLGVNLGLDNLLGFNDFLSLTHRRAQPYESGKRSSWFNNLSYVLPWGYNTFSLSLSDSEYASLLKAPSGARLKTNGDSQTYTFLVDRVLWRGQTGQWNLSGALTQKEQDNYLEDILLAVSSRRLSVFDLDSTYTTRMLGGAFSLNLGLARGLHLFGSLKDASNLPDWAPRAQFTKYKYGLGYFRPFQLLGQGLSFNSQLNGQYASDVLYGSERMSLGSPYTVRGFNEESIAGDHGYYWRNELALNRPFLLPSGHPALLRPFIGMDYGKAWNREDESAGDLSSASLGVSVMTGPLSLNLTLAHPLNSPKYETDQGDSLAFSLSLSL